MSPLKKKILTIIVIIFVVAIAVVAAYSTYQLYLIKNPVYQQKMLEKQTNKIIQDVGKIFELPTGAPQIATVADVDSLKASQPFFDKARNGDQVLIYDALAILYRPSEHKIINVAPVTKESPSPTPAPIVTPPEPSPEELPPEETSSDIQTP